jgi:hypothetical protein
MELESDTRIPIKGPLISRQGLAIHGFTRGCGVGTALASIIDLLKKNGQIMEFDLKSAYESVDLAKAIDDSNYLRHSCKLISAISSSRLIIRKLLIQSSSWKGNEFATAMMKQFPHLPIGTKSFTLPFNGLLQGSALSPIMFNFWLLKVYAGLPGVAYGDNIYINEINPDLSPVIEGCSWSRGEVLINGGCTLGLNFFIMDFGRVHVSAPHAPFARGVQKHLDLINDI